MVAFENVNSIISTIVPRERYLQAELPFPQTIEGTHPRWIKVTPPTIEDNLGISTKFGPIDLDVDPLLLSYYLLKRSGLTERYEIKADLSGDNQLHIRSADQGISSSEFDYINFLNRFSIYFGKQTYPESVWHFYRANLSKFDDDPSGRSKFYDECLEDITRWEALKHPDEGCIRYFSVNVPGLIYINTAKTMFSDEHDDFYETIVHELEHIILYTKIYEPNFSSNISLSRLVAFTIWSAVVGIVTNPNLSIKERLAVGLAGLATSLPVIYYVQKFLDYKFNKASRIFTDIYFSETYARNAEMNEMLLAMAERAVRVKSGTVKP